MTVKAGAVWAVWGGVQVASFGRLHRPGCLVFLQDLATLPCYQRDEQDVLCICEEAPVFLLPLH